jgi:citrate synthase
MSNGLENVVAAETVLSDVDGLAGRLVIRGLPLALIAGRMSAEQVTALLWQDFFPGLPRDLVRPIARARVFVWGALSPHVASVADLSLFDGLRALVARLPDSESLDDALNLVAAPAVLLPALLRQQRGLSSIAPDAELGQAADMLRMMDGSDADPARVAALDAYLVTVADHGLNASTFAARVVASTGAGLTSSVLAALGALKGPLHGGAPGPVLDMLDAIGSADQAEDWIATELAAARRLMGFGHRIYRVRDPRADALAAAIERLRRSGGGDRDRLALATVVEAAALAALARHKPERPLATNVEFYTALLLEAVGFPRDAFTPVFAAGRVSGWLAHAREQVATGKLIRPKSTYIGPVPLAA